MRRPSRYSGANLTTLVPGCSLPDESGHKGRVGTKDVEDLLLLER